MERPSSTESMLSSIPSTATPTALTRHVLRCPVWNSTVCAIEQGGLSVRCKSCKQIHFYTRAMVEQVWDELEAPQPVADEQQGE